MELQEFIKTHSIPGKVIFLKLWGSRSHGTQIESSDWDFSGVYVVPTKQLLGLESFPETCDGNKPDFSFHEIKKFCLLLVKGNPGILEMLYTEKECQETEMWKRLKAERHRFLTKQVVSAYLGYATDQMKRMQKGTYLHTKGGEPGEKWCYHMIRVLKDASRIAQGQEPVVWKEGKELELLMDIRNGKIPLEEVQAMAEDMIQTIKSIPLTLPDHADKEFLENWLLEIRHGH
jgi:hypothetical protein